MWFHDVLGLLCGLTVVLVLVMVIGRGLWQLCAWFFRTVAGQGVPSPGQLPSRSSRKCPACGHPSGLAGGRCICCGFSLSQPPAASRQADVEATKRELTRWRNEGRLSEDIFRSLMSLAAASDQAAVGRAAPAAPAAPPGRGAPASPFGPPREAPAAARGGADRGVAAEPPPGPGGPLSTPAPISADVVIAAELVEPVAPPVVVRAPAPQTPAPRPPVAPVAARPAPWDFPEPPAAPARPTARQTLADMLQAFMEQKNIRWAELISGLLIVVSAVGLVISLRATLEDIPYFPALMFLLVTAAIHGAGMYSLRRWNLKATSRAVLIIGTLLVPLAFLASIWLSGSGKHARASGDAAYIFAVAIGLAAFGTLNYFAARALLRHGWWRLMTAVLGTSAGQLLINRVEPAVSGPGGAALLMTLPLGAFLVAAVALLHVSLRRSHFGLRPAQQFFLEVGVGTFALLAPIGLYVAKADGARGALADLSPVLSLAAVALVALGLVAHRRLSGPYAASYRTAGTAVAIGGAGLMLLMLVFAWPQLPLLVAIGLVNFVALTLLAGLADLAVLHVPAVACLGVAYISGFHLLSGRVTGDEAQPGLSLVWATFTGRCGVALAVLVSAVAAAGGVLLKEKRRAAGHSYLQAAAGLAGLCLAIVGYAGFWAGPAVGGDLAAPVLLYFAALAIATGWILRVREATVLGSALLLVASVQTLGFNSWVHERLDAGGLVPGRPILVAFLIHSLVAGALALVARMVKPHRRDDQHAASIAGGAATAPSLREAVARPLGWSALVTSVCATPFAMATSQDRCGEHALYMLCTAVVWMGWAWTMRSALALAVFQILATISLSFTTVAICVHSQWWTGRILDARHVYAQISVLAAWCAGWVVFRRLVRKPEARRADGAGSTRSPAAVLLGAQLSGVPTVDQILLGGLVVAAFFAAFSGCLPGLSCELGLDRPMADANTACLLWSGIRAWCAVALVALALVATLWERRSLTTMAGAVVLSAAVPLLIATRFTDQQAAGSALRWLAAAFGAAWCVPACLGSGRTRPTTAWSGDSTLLSSPTDVMRALSLLLGGATVLVLTTAVLWRVAEGQALGGPAAESWFARIGPAVSYAVPLAVLVAVLLAYALREAQAGYMFGASLVFQYFVTLACVLPVLTSGKSFDATVWAQLLQANAVGLAVFTGLWVAVQPWLVRAAPSGSRTLTGFPLLEIQICLLIAVHVVIAAWIGGALLQAPAGGWPAVAVLGRWPGYLGSLLAAAGLAWFFRPGAASGPRASLGALTSVLSRLLRTGTGSEPTAAEPKEHVHGAVSVPLFQRVGSDLFCTALGFAVVATHLVAASFHARDLAAAWHGFHVLESGWLLVAVAAVVGAYTFTLWRRHELTAVPLSTIQIAVVWATVALAVAVVAAVRGGWNDPQRPWWSAAVTVTALLLAGALAIRGRQQRFAYASTALAAVAATLLWAGFRRPPLDSPVILLAWNATGVLLIAIAWLALEIVFQRRGAPGLALTARVPAIHRLVSSGAIALSGLWFLLAGLIIMVARHLVRWPNAELIATATALALLLILLALSLWDRRAVYGLFGLYVWCLAVAAFVLVQLSLGRDIRTVALVGVLAVQVAGSGLLWYSGANWAAWGQRLGIAEPVAGLRRTARWLPGCNLALAAVVAATGAVVVLTFHARELRVAAGCLPLLLAGGVAALTQQQRRAPLQLLSILAIVLAAVFLGWADQEPVWSTQQWLYRTIRLLIACGGAAFVLGVVVVRFLPDTNNWRFAARQAAVVAGAAAIAVLLAVLALEAVLFQPGEGAPVDALQIAAVSVVLVALLVALLSLAVLPGRDPLQLSERGRMAYVYGAQVVAALLFAHIYLAKPEWFTGRLHDWWPYIVLVIAFAGVGVGAVFRRLGWRVLAEPFQNSGAFLPLVPVLGFWVVHSESTYSSVLFTIGVLYMLLSFARKSFGWGVAAAAAGNGALWSLLAGTEDFTFAAHPQFWLIPPAVSVLVAAQINRRRLGEAQLTAIRYAAVSLIYLSSSAEMLKIGIGESLWPPIILISLSVVGVAFGIALQVRAYLYMGTGFILVSLVSMVAHAARSIHHVWPWWAFGIALGGLILFIFGWFEGHRAQVLRLIERLRQWEK